MTAGKTYYIRTWDPATEAFTPQKGVPVGPYWLWGLRTALRELRLMGYEATRDDGSTLVEDEEAYGQKTTR